MKWFRFWAGATIVMLGFTFIHAVRGEVLLTLFNGLVALVDGIVAYEYYLRRNE